MYKRQELLRFIGQGRHRVAGIGVGCHRVRRNVLIQIHDLCNKGILSGIGAADRYRNGHGLRGGGGMPFDPDYLTVTGWDHYIIDPVGGAENMEGNRCRIIRRQILICPQCDGCLLYTSLCAAVTQIPLQDIRQAQSTIIPNASRI